MEEATMQGNFLTSVTAVAISATLGVSTLAAAQTAPPIGGGYANAIAIPVDNPTTKSISGALFKPAGAGQICDARRQRCRRGGESPQRDAGHRPRSYFRARLFIWGDIVALRHGREDAGGARHPDRRGHRVLSLLL